MFVVLKKKQLIVAVVLLAIVAVLSVMVGSEAVVATAAKNRLVPIYGVKTEEPKLAMTFDAAWGADKTREIMDNMEEYGYKCTFFLVGFWVDKYPELVKEIYDRGHLIGNHSTNHLHASALSEAELREEMEVTSAKIEAITGERPVYFRAPFGEYDNRLINIAKEKGMQVIQWSIDTLDWKGISAAQISERVLQNAANGSIVLCHNNSDYIVDALPIILLGLKNKGLTPVRLDELVLSDGYSIDNNGIQIKN